MVFKVYSVGNVFCVSRYTTLPYNIYSVRTRITNSQKYRLGVGIPEDVHRRQDTTTDGTARVSRKTKGNNKNIV